MVCFPDFNPFLKVLHLRITLYNEILGTIPVPEIFAVFKSLFPLINNIHWINLD